jgi:tetratricopeptide (TPR) repeat protein
LFLVLIMALSVLTRSAWGAPPQQSRARVVELVKQSAAHYDAGLFDQAIELLLEAYEIEKSPTILYNLARAYEGRGDSSGARRASQLRRQDRKQPIARRRAAHRQPERQLEKTPSSAARRGSQSEAEARREAARKRPEKRPEPPAPREPSILPWIVAGAGAAIVGGGVYFGLRSEERHDEATDAELARDAESLNDDARTFALLANVSFAVGGALVVGGVSWGLLDLAASGDQRVGVTAGGKF